MPAGDAAVTASFAKNTYAVTAKASPAEGGKVSGAGTVAYGSGITLKAKAKSGYYFVKWTEKGKTVGKKTTLKVKNIKAAHSYKAVFKKPSMQFSLRKFESNKIKVHWKTVKGAKGYQVANNDTASGKMKTKWTGSNSYNTYTSIMKRQGVTYKFQTRYYKIKKGEKVWSDWTPVKTKKR
jgi:hypothetical protein